MDNKKNTATTTTTTTTIALKQSLTRLLRRTTCSTKSDATPSPPISVHRPYYHLNNLPLSFNSLEISHIKSSNYRKNYKKVVKKERRLTEVGSFYETGVHEGRRCPPTSPISPSKYSPYFFCFDNEKKRMKKKKKKKKLLSNAYGFTTSSSSDEELGGFFSSEDGEEGREDCSETFFSTKSFSSDSSEFYQRPLSISSKRITHKREISTSSSSSRRRRTSNGYHPLVSVMSYDDHKKKKKKVKSRNNFVMDDNEEDEDEKNKGIAVVKKSKDPYGDFRSSMLEMIVERQMFGPRDLQRLLHSYLSLNSDHHHPIILKAFSDIWEALFSN